MDDSARFLVSALAAGISGAPASALPAAADWGRIVWLAEDAHLCGLLLRGLHGTAIRPPAALGARLQAAADRAAYTEAVQHFETERLCAALAVAGVRYCPLKGTVLRSLYPSPELREMVDVDILIPSEARAKAKEAMLALGYRLNSEDSAHDAYTLPPVMAVELHHQLLSEKSRFQQALAQPWTWLVPTGAQREYRLPPTQEFLFLLLHIEKHLSEAGVGARDILDLFLFRRAHSCDLDCAVMKERLQALGLQGLGCNLLALAEAWFGDGAMTPALEGIGEYVLESGVHGTIRQSVKQNYLTTQDTSAARTRAQYLRYRLFPPRDELAGRYPALKRRPWLRAVYLPRYWWNAAVGSAADTRARYRAMRAIGDDELAAHRRVMQMIYEDTNSKAPFRE